MSRLGVGLLLALLSGGPSTAREISADTLDSLPQADVVVLGEVHDNPLHHEHQARAVAAIAPAALVFEMLGAAQVAALPSDLKDAAAVARATEWEARGWPDFTMCHPIFTAAPAARIYAGDVPRSVVRMALRDGAVAAFGQDAARFGLTQPFPATVQAEQERSLLAAHCFAMPKEALPGMVEAQRLRDATLAAVALQALRETGGPVVVITGVEHARTDIGAPALIRNAAPEVTVLSIGQFETAPQGQPPHDLWMITEGVPGRGDPCAAFGSTAG